MGYKCRVCNHEGFKVTKYKKAKISFWKHVFNFFRRWFGYWKPITFNDMYLCTTCGQEYKESELMKWDVSDVPIFRNYYLMTKPENNFYQVLLKCVEKKYVVFPQVPLHAIVKSKNQTYRNKIDRKRLDYVIFSDKYYSPILVIELDDSSHNLPERQERDALVDKILFKANIPILHIKNSNKYETSNISSLINNKIRLWNYRVHKK